MRILYIPDWNEKHNEKKLELMSKLGAGVQFFPYDIYNHRNFIHIINNELQKCPTLLVGNYLGAYFAHYASNAMRVPCLMFNPSFFFKNSGELKAELKHSEYPEKKIILAMRDEQVDTKRSFKYLKELGYEHQIKIIDNATHEITLDDFENFFGDFYSVYKDFKHPDFDPSKPKERKKEKEDFWNDPVARTYGGVRVDVPSTEEIGQAPDQPVYRDPAQNQADAERRNGEVVFDGAWPADQRVAEQMVREAVENGENIPGYEREELDENRPVVTPPTEWEQRVVLTMAELEEARRNLLRDEIIDGGIPHPTIENDNGIPHHTITIEELQRESIRLRPGIYRDDIVTDENGNRRVVRVRL